MKPKQQSWSIVVLGSWNRRIFTTDWVAPHVFGLSAGTSIEVLVPMMPDHPTVYRTDAVALAVDDTQLIISPRRIDLDTMRQSEGVAVQTLKQLPHTPLTGIGVNFGFKETDLGDELLELFNLPDDEAIGGLGWDIGVRKIVRALTKGTRKLNLTFTLTPTSMEIGANFHYDAKMAEDAGRAIEGQTSSMHDELLELLSEAHHLEPEGENP